MKKLWVLLTFLFFSVASFGQPATDTVFTKDYFLKKSRTQKNIGWGLLVGGTALVVAGVVTSDEFRSGVSYGPGNPRESELDTEDVLLIGGVVAGLTSVVFFASSAKNKRKAAAISFSGQTVPLPQGGRFIARPQPAVTARLGL